MAGYALKHFLNVPYIYIIPSRAGRLARFHFLLSHSFSKSGEHETIKTSKRGYEYSAAKRVFTPPCSGPSHSRERGYIIRNGKEGAGRILPFRTNSRLPSDFALRENILPGRGFFFFFVEYRICFICECVCVCKNFYYYTQQYIINHTMILKFTLRLCSVNLANFLQRKLNSAIISNFGTTSRRE